MTVEVEMTISRIFMAFTEIANKSPLLDLGSELSLEKPFQNGILELCPWVIDMLLPAVFYSDFTPRWEGVGTFISVMSKDGCLGKKCVPVETWRISILSIDGGNLESAQRLYSEIFKYVIKQQDQDFLTLVERKYYPTLGVNSECWMMSF